MNGKILFVSDDVMFWARIHAQATALGRESENSAAPSFVIAATKLFSCITTVRNLTMPPGRSVPD